MPNIPVTLVARTNDGCLGFLVQGKRVDFYFHDLGMFEHVRKRTKHFLNSGWTNYLVAYLTSCASEIDVNGKSLASRKQTCVIPIEDGDKNMSVNYSKVPSEEYSYTVIAPQAKSLHYAGERQWFKTIEDAKAAAQEVYDGINGERKSFELAIVQVVDVVKPEPRTKLISTFKKESASQ